MGKTVKKVLKIAAFVAIATFAAPVAAAIGLSAAVGTIAGAAIVGAAAGAATNGILGGGILKGALMGGVGGAFGGLSKVLSTPGTGLFGDAYAASAAPSAVVPGAASSVEGAVSGAAPGAAEVAEGGVLSGTTAGAETAADIVVNGARTGLSSAAPGLAAPTATGVAAAAPTVAAQPQAQPQQADSNRWWEAAGDTPLVTPGTATPATMAGVVAATPAAAAATAPVQAAGQAGPTLLSRAGNVAKAVVPQLVTTALAGGAQQNVVEQQQQALEDQKRQFDANYNLKTQYAQGLIDDANYYNPEGAGRRAAESARIRAGLSASNAARGADPRHAEALRRQGEIEGGRAATRDYWSAYDTAGTQRTGLRKAGIEAIPLMSSPPGSSAYDSAYTAAGKQGAGIAGIINSGISAWGATDRNEDEIKKLGAG